MTDGHSDGNCSIQPLLSIITINRNNAVGLRRTFACLSRQSYTEYEQIVVDGNSTDGSCHVILKPEFKVHRWLSESDSGIYNAMNKGIRMAQGKYLLFLNSGDHLFDNLALANAISAMDDSDVQCFDLLVRGHSELNGGVDYVKTYPDKIDFSYMAVESLPHPATFIRASLFGQFGMYDETLRICADWKQFTLWLCKHNCTYKHHAIPLSVFYMDGLSGDPKNREALLAERRHVLHTEFTAFERDLHDLVQARDAIKSLAALRQSKIIRLLRKTGLLWDF